MMNLYKSDYPNQVHQLSVYISKNYYLLKNGVIKYQDKKFDINWDNYSKTKKEHLVSFVIRDHCSGCFYAEIYSINEIPHIKEFLFNAWKQKENYEFYGIPENLIIGKHVIDMWPELSYFTENNKIINIELAQNGFATGIRATKEWERNISFYTSFKNNKTLKEFQSNIEIICRNINHRKNSKKDKSSLEKWSEDTKGTALFSKDKERFYKSFNE